MISARYTISNNVTLSQDNMQLFTWNNCRSSLFQQAFIVSTRALETNVEITKKILDHLNSI